MLNTNLEKNFIGNTKRMCYSKISLYYQCLTGLQCPFCERSF